MRRSTEWRCNWRGFAGCNTRDCGTRYRVPVAPSTAVRRARELDPPWEFIHDERLEARDLDPSRPRYLILCPAHGRKWTEWFGPRYRLPEARAVALVRELNARQQTLFSDEHEDSPRASGLHAKD